MATTVEAGTRNAQNYLYPHNYPDTGSNKIAGKIKSSTSLQKMLASTNEL